METGTGKTYCYLKTMFELNRSYGWSKFIVVVPSIAIREGVFKSLEITAEHFLQDYGKKARAFIYNSKQLHELESFACQFGVMGMEKIKRILEVIAAAAGIAGVLSLAISIYQISNVYKDERLKKWQSVVVYRSLEQAGKPIRWSIFIHALGGFFKKTKGLKKDEATDMLGRHITALLEQEGISVERVEH